MDRPHEGVVLGSGVRRQVAERNERLVLLPAVCHPRRPSVVDILPRDLGTFGQEQHGIHEREWDGLRGAWVRIWWEPSVGSDGMTYRWVLDFEEDSE
jgi:hypothetical protein